MWKILNYSLVDTRRTNKCLYCIEIVGDEKYIYFSNISAWLVVLYVKCFNPLHIGQHKSSINCTKYLMQEYAFSFLIYHVSFIIIYLFLTHHNGRIFRFVSIHLLIALFTCQNEKNRVCQSYQWICATFPPPNWHPIWTKRSKCFRFWRIHVAFRKREIIFGAGHAALTAHNRT